MLTTLPKKTTRRIEQLLTTPKVQIGRLHSFGSIKHLLLRKVMNIAKVTRIVVFAAKGFTTEWLVAVGVRDS